MNKWLNWDLLSMNNNNKAKILILPIRLQWNIKLHNQIHIIVSDIQLFKNNKNKRSNSKNKRLRILDFSNATNSWITQSSKNIRINLKSIGQILTVKIRQRVYTLW